MYKKWLSYTLRARNARQKYFTLLQQKVNARTTRVLANTRARIIKGIAIGTVGLVAYYFGNKMRSEHFQKKQMKKKLMKAYPDQTFIISFQQDPIELLREVEIKSTIEEQEVTPLQNNHCILIKEESEQINQLKTKLGSTVIIFSPKNIDQLCHAIQRCYKYRHTAIVGDYPMPDVNKLEDYALLKRQLSKIKEPLHKSKYVVIDLSLFKNSEIDEVNQILQADSGALCRELNEKLQQRGYEPLFKKFSQNLTVYDVISNNLPLESNELLTNRIQNLSLVSAEGKRFKSSTEVQNFGQIPNLTPLFVGTGGVFAVPAKINIKLQRKQDKNKKLLYTLQNDNKNFLVMQWRQFRQYLSSKKIPYKLRIQKDNKIQIQTEFPVSLYQYLQNPSEETQQIRPVDYIFSINNSIMQKILLNGSNNSSIVIQNNLLQIESVKNPQQVRKLISDISLEGGVLVWCKDRQMFNHIKERTDILEAGAELMKKIVEIREGIDKRQVLYSHSRYQKYFAKGFFRKMTQVFW